MARAERIGLAAALVGHALLFAALSLGWPNAPEPPKPLQQPIDVSLVKDVALQSAAPVIAPPAPSVAPEQGPPEDAAPPPEAAEPEPAPPAPAPPRPAPPKAAPKPVSEKPAPKPEPAPKAVAKPVAKPAPAPKPEPKPARPQPAKDEPKPESKPAKAAPAKPAPAKAAPAKSSAVAATPTKAKPAATTGKGSDAAAKTTRAHGSRLGDDFLKGLADAPPKPAPAPAAAAPAAKVGAQQAANIASAILRQVQPCANRQVTPGPGAERIRVTINLRLNRDGSLAARPHIVNHDGVDDENRRYLARVDDLAIATFVGCAPLQGLPDSLYDVQGGWSNFTMRYKLPG